MQQYIPIVALIIIAVFLLWAIFPSNSCSSKSIHCHNHYLAGSLFRKCADCGAEFHADYFEAREGGGHVLQYYRMTKPGSPDFKTKSKQGEENETI